MVVNSQHYRRLTIQQTMAGSNVLLEQAVAENLNFAAQHRFSTYYVNCHQLTEQLKKARFENRLPDRLKILARYKMLIIDKISYLPMDIQGANLYEKTSTVINIKGE